MRTLNQIKYKKFIFVMLKYKGYLGPNLRSIDSSLYPYLIGKRGEKCFYDLNKSTIGIKQMLEFFENIVVERGRILLVGGSIPLVSVLLCLGVGYDSNLRVIPWTFSRISKTSHQDFLIIHEVDKKAVLEAYGKMLPMSGTHYPSIQGISYPINVNLASTGVFNWYSWGIVSSYRRGRYRRLRGHYEI